MIRTNNANDQLNGIQYNSLYFLSTGHLHK